MRPKVRNLFQPLWWGLLGRACLLGAVFLTPLQGSESTDAHYVLATGDSVQITVFGEPDLLTERRIDPQGEIRVPLLGNVPLAGLTVRGAEEALETAFTAGEFLRAPQVSVRVQNYAERFFSVLGQVRSPGRKQFPPEKVSISIVEVISEAGGFTGIARGDSVRVTRINADSGEEETFTVDVDRVVSGRGSGGREAPGFEIIPGDIIFVPERLF